MHCTDQFRPQLDHSDSHHCAIPNLGQMALNVACYCFSGPVWEWSPADGVGEAGKRESGTRAAEETPPAGAGRPGTGHRSQQGRDDQRLTTFPSDPPFCTLQRRLCACVMDHDKNTCKTIKPLSFCVHVQGGLWFVNQLIHFTCTALTSQMDYIVYLKCICLCKCASTEPWTFEESYRSLQIIIFTGWEKRDRETAKKV